MWAPKLFALYSKVEVEMLAAELVLDFIAKHFPFAAATANFGPRTFCLSHRDLKNLAFGLCVIIALGKFDFQKGGHLILHELKLIVEMRPGDIAFIPSAVVSHENVPVAEDETRQSLVFYSAGGLFRWIDAGRQSYKAWKESNTEAYERHQREGEARWKSGWSLFTVFKPPQT